MIVTTRKENLMLEIYFIYLFIYLFYLFYLFILFNHFLFFIYMYFFFYRNILSNYRFRNLCLGSNELYPTSKEIGRRSSEKIN